MPAISCSRRLLLLAPLLTLVLALAACGQKGPLYLPAPEADAPPVKTADEAPQEEADQEPSEGSW